jgi:hypothetical protein
VEFIPSGAQIKIDDKISSAQFAARVTARIDRLIAENGKVHIPT